VQWYSISTLQIVLENHITTLCQQLNCSLPSVCKKYLHHLHTFALQHNLVPCLDSLFLLAQAPTTTKADLQQALESFNHTKAEGMQYAEKHCWKFHMGLIQYSPELNLWHHQKTLWQLVLLRKQGCPIRAKYINHLAKACQVLIPLGATTFQANQALQESTSCYLALKPQHNLL